jgi:hypothetical protein
LTAPFELAARGELGRVADIDNQNIAPPDHLVNLGRVQAGHHGIGFGQHFSNARRHRLVLPGLQRTHANVNGR